LGTGHFIVDSRLQSLVLVTAMVLSSLADSSFPRVGKASCVTVLLWCRRVPSSRFSGFSRMGRGATEDNILWPSAVLVDGGCAERLYTLMRSSVAPVASRTFCVWPWTGAEGGDRARHRMAEACAVNRKESAKRALALLEDTTCAAIGSTVEEADWL
jgi:hypothetical protein